MMNIFNRFGSPLTLAFGLFVCACGPVAQSSPDKEKNEVKSAYFASGCFWCVEGVYESVRGVDEAIAGYIGGTTEEPTYDTVKTGETGHAQGVRVDYDPAVISFGELVDVYFGSQNVTQVNGQGSDEGSQYRSLIFYQSDEEKKIIEEKIAALEANLDGEKVAAEVKPFDQFWKAEDSHQDYKENNPDDDYVKSVSTPRVKKFKAKFPDLLKDS